MMATKIIMPKAGMAMEEGTIVKWLKKEGDKVEQGEPLLEILTDKVNMEVEALVSGIVLKILKEEGEVVPVTQPIGYIGQPGEIIEEIVSDLKILGKEVEKDPSVMKEENFDIVVIGGGPAGYVAAIKGAQLGGKVALVEKDMVGGTCLNRGCIPTKTFLKNAELIENIKHAGNRGIILNDTSYRIDMEKTVQIKNEIVKILTEGVAGLLKSHGVKVYKGNAKLTKDKKVKINATEILTGKKIILAAGSKAAKISVPGIESALVLTSDEILDLKEVPGHLAIIGGGVIGIELAMLFHAYGSQISIIEMTERILPGMDKEISEELFKILTQKGIKIHTSRKLEMISEQNGKLSLFLQGQERIGADKALLSIGRVPDLEALRELELQMNSGKIKVNEYMETSMEGVYAPGDINGVKMLAHAAFKMGEVAAANAMGKKEKVQLNNVPGCIYTIPEVGVVGLTEDEAKAKYDIRIGKFPFAGNGRALASGESIGFVKVIADKKYGEILGVHIIGPGATEMINEAASLMEMEITVHEAANIIHGHPTFSEAFKEACADCLGTSIHLPNQNEKWQII